MEPIRCRLVRRWNRGLYHFLGWAVAVPGHPTLDGCYLGRTRDEARRVLADWNARRRETGHPVLIED